MNNDSGMGGPWGVAFGKNSIWEVADYTKDFVYIFDNECQLITKIGSKCSMISQLDRPAGVAFDSNDHLYAVYHSNNTVEKFTIEGRHLVQLGGIGHS